MKLQIAEPLPPRCGKRPSKRSTARCEKPLSMVHFDHAGRTRGGYWKFWTEPER